MFLILSQEHYPEVEKGLNAIRTSDEPMTVRLNRLVSELKKKTKACRKDELVYGRRYGVFGISHFANAWRDRRLIPNHGEVYLYVWTLGEDGVFYTVNGWGTPSFSNNPSGRDGRNLLIEIP